MARSEAQAPAPAPAPSAVGAMPAPNQVIYAPRLPSAAELTNVAAAQGLTVAQINETSTQIVVVYKYPNGQTNTVAYQLLPTQPTATTTVVTPSAPPTVVYETAPRVVYYESYPAYYPRYYYPPVSVHLGFGYNYSRGWGGGYRHWR